MGFRVEVQGEAEVLRSLKTADAAVSNAVKEVQKDNAEEIKKRIEDTAPVRTGRYRDDWELKEKGGVHYLKNTISYAPYLVYPNGRFVGSAAADDPSRGILHNVRGIVHEQREKYKKSMIKDVRKTLEALNRT